MASLNTSLEKMPAESHALYEKLKEKRGVIDGMYLTLLNHPALAQQVSQLGTYLRFEATLPGDVREVMVLLTAHADGAEYEWIKHEPCARAAGVPEDVIAAIRSGNTAAGLPPDYRMLEEVRRCVVERRNIPPTTQDELVRRWGTNGLLELVVLVGFYRMINGIVTSFDVPLPSSA